MKKFPMTTAKERRDIVRQIREVSVDEKLLDECIDDVYPQLKEYLKKSIIDRNSYDSQMDIPFNRKGFYRYRVQVIALYMERMNDDGRTD